MKTSDELPVFDVLVDIDSVTLPNLDEDYGLEDFIEPEDIGCHDPGDIEGIIETMADSGKQVLYHPQFGNIPLADKLQGVFKDDTLVSACNINTDGEWTVDWIEIL